MSEVAPIEYNIKGQRVRSTGDPLKDFQAIQKLFPEVNAGKLAPLIRAQFPSAPYSDEAYLTLSTNFKDSMQVSESIRNADMEKSLSRMKKEYGPDYDANLDEAHRRFLEDKKIDPMLKEVSPGLGENRSSLGDSIDAAAHGFSNTITYGAIPYLKGFFGAVGGDRPSPEKSFLDNVKRNIKIEKLVSQMRSYDSPVGTTAGSMAGLFKGPIGSKALTSAIEGSALAASSPKLAAALTRTGEGALQGLGSTMAVNPNASSSEAAIGTASGAALNNVFGLFGDLLNKVAGKLGEKGWNSLLGQTPKQILKEQEKTGSSLGEKLYKRGVWGVSENSLMNQAKKGLESNEDILQTLLKEKSVAKEIVPEIPKGSVYVSEPTQASLDDLLDIALGQKFKSSNTSSTGFPERVIITKPAGTNPNVMRPDPIINRTSEAPLGLRPPESVLPRGNVIESFPEKPNLITQDSLSPKIIESGKIDKSFMLKELTKLKDNFKGVVGRDSDLAKIEDTIQQIKNSADLSPIEANEIKRNIYKLRENSYNKDINPLQTMIEKAQAKGLKEGIEDVIPEAKGINQELSVFGKLKDALDLLSAKGKTDTISKSTTATGLIADMLFNSPLVNTAGPQVIKGVGGITQQSNKLASPILMQLIDSLLNPPQQKRQGAYQ